MEGIIIKDIICKGNRLDIDFTVTKGLEQYFLPEHHFFAEYTCDISDVPPSVLVVPLLANLMPMAWLLDCIVWVNEVDRDFYEALYRIKRGFQEMYPNYQFRGSLIPAYMADNRYAPRQETIALFTGGIDASTTFLRHLTEKPILFNSNGWFVGDIHEDAVYTADRNAIEAIAREFGVENCFVRSNFATFIRADRMSKYMHDHKVYNTWWFGFQHSLAFLGCAAVAGYHYRINRMYIGSSYTFGDTVKLVSDPRIDNHFQVASMDTVHDGYELSRQDKVHYLCQQQKLLQRELPLRVCSFNDHNCCACEKCMRTMLSIIAEGGNLRDFGFIIQDTFLNTLKAFLNASIPEIDHNHAPFWRDIITKMGENYDILQEREVYDYLKDFDFDAARKAWHRQYYRKNFFKILKRKLELRKSK